MDKVIIRDLAVDTIVGLYPWERIARQTLWLDIDLGTDIRQAAKDQDLQFTIDYSAVCDEVITYIQTQEFTLIEALADRVAGLVQDRFGVKWIRVAVYKTDVLTRVGRVGIEIERGSMG